MATILAALRHFQKTVPYDNRDDLEHFEECYALDDEQIDDLCERINLGE